jgi:hypothetical protein
LPQGVVGPIGRTERGRFMLRSRANRRRDVGRLAALRAGNRNSKRVASTPDRQTGEADRYGPMPVGRLPASSFARGQRAKVLAALGQSATALKRKRTCKAITALDLAHCVK